MADDAISFECRVESEDLIPDYEDTENGIEYLPEWRRIQIRTVDSSGYGTVSISMPLSDLPSARVGDKVQVALFLRPSE